MVLGGVNVTVPPQMVALALGTVSPVGRSSVKPTPVSALGLAAGLVIVNVSAVESFGRMAVGLKPLVNEGGASTLMDADAVPPSPPSVEVTAVVVLFWVPG